LEKGGNFSEERLAKREHTRKVDISMKGKTPLLPGRGGMEANFVVGEERKSRVPPLQKGKESAHPKTKALREWSFPRRAF